jgi:hypothetical protein
LLRHGVPGVVVEHPDIGRNGDERLLHGEDPLFGPGSPDPG